MRKLDEIKIEHGQMEKVELKVKKRFFRFLLLRKLFSYYMKKYFLRFCSATACLLFILLVISRSISSAATIIADHTVVDRYDQIPAYWINEVKKMWVDVPGESHSGGYRRGLALLALQNSLFAASVTESGTPEGYRSDALRISRASWGDIDVATGWQYSYGEEDFWTSQLAVERTKAHLTYANTHNLAIAAFGFGWCWDMSWQNDPGGTVDPVYKVHWAGSTVGGPNGNMRWGLDDADNALTGNTLNMDDYLAAVDAYRAHCTANSYPTKVFFTTGPADDTDESGYQRQLKNEHIRQHVQADETRILFDYADILCYSDAGALYEETWLDAGGGVHLFPCIHPENMQDLNGGYTEDGDHIGEVGTIRLAKALWWMLARMAGWDGLSSTVSIDTDGDGVEDVRDNCPNSCNPRQLDANSNGIGDVCDITPGCGGCGQPACDLLGQCDLDHDGIFDFADNCPNIANPQQLDTDQDSIGDACDATPGCGGCGQLACERSGA
jgi:hypothetical protein